jgi:site-specific recombinase XerD
MRLSEVVSLYISHKRSLGHRFRTEEYLLQAFCRVVGDNPISTIEEKAVLTFLNDNGQVTEFWIKKYHVLSGLYRFALGRGLANISPLPRIIPKLTVPAFVPYIYSHEELKRLLDAIPAACSNFVPIEEDVLRTFILLLYGAGLRISEALGLTLDKVDLRQACLSIRETKFFKNRLVPMGKDLTEILSEYILTFHHGAAAPMDAPLFCFRNGSPLSQSAARSAFRRMRLYAGVRREGGANRQPRLHDLRHTSAVHRLVAWYQNGADLQELLPKLAIYLGHVDLSSTQRYLTLTPELLREASNRFEHYAMGDNHD